MMLSRRYLDHAATSWPKPPEVVAAWQRAALEIGATAGRGLYAASREATAIRERARAAAARLFGDVEPERVALPAGCTLALNMAIHGLARPGDHLIATAADHNATLRPLHRLAEQGLIELSIVPCDATGRVDPAAIAAAWRPATRLAVISHVSNVTGVAQDIEAVADIVHARGGLLVLDAAQSLGIVPCDAPGWDADVVAAPAHKWLQGMAGVAMLWARPGVDPEPLVQGGTGTLSESLEMPAAFPARMEAGSPDVPALAAVEAAFRWLAARGLETTAAERAGCKPAPTERAACREGHHEHTVGPGLQPGQSGPPNPPALGAHGRTWAGCKPAPTEDQLAARGLEVTAAASRRLADALAGRLDETRGVRVIGGPRAAGIVSFVVEGYDPAEVAAILEQAAGVEVRAGFHCAACIHEFLGTKAGGTVRAAFGPANDAADVEAVAATVESIRAG
jgi:cysteine desulfurase/selenocysteine lyase